MSVAEIDTVEVSAGNHFRHLDVETGKLEPVATIFKAMTGKRLNPPTQWRWINKGNSGVRLEAVPLNGCWCTTRHAFAMFLQDQATARIADPVPAADPGPRDERTTRKLRAAGLIK